MIYELSLFALRINIEYDILTINKESGICDKTPIQP
jgi:hypothetical protein